MLRCVTENNTFILIRRLELLDIKHEKVYNIKKNCFPMASTVIALFVAVNLYVYFVSHMSHLFRDHHGERHGFIISNIIIIAAMTLAALFALL